MFFLTKGEVEVFVPSKKSEPERVVCVGKEPM
jgi:hypothetical protein